MLQHKKEVWRPDEVWNFKPKDDLIYIENISKTKVLGTSNDGEVVLEDFAEDKTEQLWRIGESNAEGYFTLENSKVPKIMTAISSSILRVIGNIPLS